MVKFRKPSGPAFNPGEVWISSAGNRVKIVSVRKYSTSIDNHCSNYGITYEWEEKGEKRTWEKDGWSFQVRYSHISDNT